MTRLTDFHGIGPALAKRLEAAGIVDGKTLAAADLAVLTAIPGVSALRATAWQKTAAGHASTVSSDDQPDTTVVLLEVSNADPSPVEDAPAEAPEPEARTEKKPAKGKKKAKKTKTKTADKPAKAKTAEKTKKAKKAETKKTASAKKKAADKKTKAKSDTDKKTKAKAKSKKKAKAA